MPKGPNGQKRPADAIGCAVMVAQIATGEQEDTTLASPNRRKSGLAGAKARNKTMSAERRSEIATQAASARWQKGENEMTDICSTGLHQLLSEGGRELHNVKFLAGANPSEQGMCAEAEKVIASAIRRGMPHNPPMTGLGKTKLQSVAVVYKFVIGSALAGPIFIWSYILFKNLQAKFDGRTDVPIEVQEICDALVEMGYQDDIRVVEEEMDLSQLLGAYVQFTEPSGGMYSEPQMVSLIVYPSNVNLLSQRMICAKELVHVCDARVSRTNDPQDILELAQVLSGNALIGDEPRMTMKVAADILAQQKGLMLLFPKAARLIARQQVAEGLVTLEDLAEKLKLPETTVNNMLEEDWEDLAEMLSGI